MNRGHVYLVDTVLNRLRRAQGLGHPTWASWRRTAYTKSRQRHPRRSGGKGDEQVGFPLPGGFRGGFVIARRSTMAARIFQLVIPRPKIKRPTPPQQPGAGADSQGFRHSPHPCWEKSRATAGSDTGELSANGDPKPSRQGCGCGLVPGLGTSRHPREAQLLVAGSQTGRAPLDGGATCARRTNVAGQAS